MLKIGELKIYVGKWIYFRGRLPSFKPSGKTENYFMSEATTGTKWSS